jgi:tetratricopeptide (TPR) repeat protein
MRAADEAKPIADRDCDFHRLKPVASMLTLLLFAAPPVWQQRYEEGVARFERGDASGAVPLLEEAAQLNPKRAQVWKALGVAWAAQGEYRSATEPFLTACRLDPKLNDACYFAGRALYASDRFDAALEPLRLGLKIDPDPGRSETALAQACDAMGRNDEAEKYFHAAIQRKSPSAVAAQVAYGNFLIRLGRASDALEPLQSAFQSRPDDESGTALGRAMVELDRVKEAIAPLETAVKADPKKVAPRLLLARVYRRLGRSADAVAQEQAALKLQGSSTTNN